MAVGGKDVERMVMPRTQSANGDQRWQREQEHGGEEDGGDGAMKRELVERQTLGCKQESNRESKPLDEARVPLGPWLEHGAMMERQEKFKLARRTF